MRKPASITATNKGQMMKHWVILGCAGMAAAGMSASGAGAADPVAGAARVEKLAFGPAPAWVKPSVIPAPDPKPDEVAVKLLLQDEQYDLTPGHQTRWFENALQIQTPQGLAAGMVSLSWNPDFEAPTIHKLLIRRGDKVIDVLASGQTFIVARRETNMENATIDGELTATIQPEGLQVGDIIDFSASIAGTDPALGRHVEAGTAVWNGFNIARAHMRAQWPASLPVQLRSTGGIAALKPAKAGGIASVELSLDDVKVITPPKGAPARFQYGRSVQISDFSSWAGVADLMGPLFAKASTLAPASPLQAEVAKIKAISPDPVKRAEAALALVQDRVRYVLLATNDGGLIPADADTTWSRRFGDCKGKTVLLLALLHGVGIDAVPVVVSTEIGDGMDARLPAVTLFNHVLVRATIGGRVYWLDGTRLGDKALDALVVPNFHWGLPLVPGTSKLVAMVPPPFAKPQAEISLRIDATAGITVPAPAHAERLLRDDDAIVTNLGIANMTPVDRDKALRAFWKAKYDFIEPKSTSYSFDPAARTLKLVMDGTAKMEWNDGYYETDGVWVGYRADFSRDPGQDQTAPFAVNYPDHTRTRETILLPPGGGTFTVYHGEDVDTAVAGIAYKRHAEIKGNVFTVEEEEHSLAPEFPASEAPAAQEKLRDLFKQTLYVRKPANYILTAAEVDAAMKETPATADAFVERGNMLLDRGRMDEAIADFGKALGLDPKSALALADRGIAHAWKGETALANADLSAAAVIDPRNAVVFRARGMLAMQGGKPAEAVAAYTTSLEIDPGNGFAIEQRAQAHRAAGEIDLAIVDANAAIKRNPRSTDMYLLLANIARNRGDQAGALRQADAVVAANPDLAYAHVVAARIRASSGLRDAAMHDFDRALALEPQGYIYINRSNVRPRTDYAGRLADLEAALKLDPGDFEALVLKAQVQQDQHDYAGAIATLTAAQALHADQPHLLVLRGAAQVKAGNVALGERDFAAAHALSRTASALNDLCWTKSTAGVALASALADCDAALALSPDASAILDSRGFALLRLGRLDDAITSYDRALAGRPTGAESLYGRAVAEARKGDFAKAETDMRAALKVNPDVGTEFEGYGVTMPEVKTGTKPKAS
ncbi:tetratricopeptide repeat protein [Sphingomonas oligophenolica]|uniref:Tetratricopeptide repeat protein n=1 Tax=Sphingomonas oligophenolica TaxID=301154 RepID=A0ABU9Y0V4_9SPHN